MPDNPPNDVSCSHSGSQVDLPPTGVRGIFRQVLIQSYRPPKWIDINIYHFLIHLIKMTNYKLYPNPSSVLPSENPQVGLNVVQAKRRGLINKEKMFKKKYERYTKILNGLTCLNACFEWNKHSHWNI